MTLRLTIGKTRTLGSYRPFQRPCVGTLHHVSDPCPNLASRALNNGLCQDCDSRVNAAMLGQLYRLGMFALASELGAAYKARAYCPMCLGTRLCEHNNKKEV